MKLYRIALFFFLSGSLSAQLKEAAGLYNEGVAKYNEQNFEEAERLFTRSLITVGDKDAYFSRALCRGKMANQKGYCQDMALASIAGHLKSTKLFLKACGKVDTVLESRPEQLPHKIISRLIVFRAADTNFRFIQKYYSQELLPGYDELVRNNDQDTTGGETFADYPGGVTELMKFIKANTSQSNFRGEAGKVYLKFIVYEDGTLHNIEVLKNDTHNPEIAEDATRIIAFMPPWKAARIGKKLVKSYFNLPINYKVH